MDTPNANPTTPAAAGAAVTGSPGVNPAESKPAGAEKPSGEAAAQRARTEEAARLAALARRERHLQTQREHARRSLEAETQRLKAEHDALLKEREELKALREAREAAKTDPLKWLEFGGHTYDSVTEAQLNGGKIAPERVAQLEAQRVEERIRAEVAKRDEEIKKLREDQDGLRKQRETEAQQATEAQMQDFRMRTAQYVESKKETFQLVNALNKGHEVAQLIEQHYSQTFQADQARARREGRNPEGEILTVDQAAEHLEKWYEEMADRAVSTAKMQARYKKLESPVAAAPGGQQAQQGQAPADSAETPAKQTVEFETRSGGVKFERKTQGQRPTLTNQIAASVQSSLPPEGVPSEAERVKRALAAMERVEAEKRARASQA